MGKMYTLQSNESINDHVKESMGIINHIVELSIGCMRDLANPHEGTFVDMTFNKFMRSLEHIRESIQMLDELCDELEEDKDEIRHEYEEKVIQFFNRFMNAGLNDETNYRLGECVRHIHEIENHYMSEIQTLTENCEHFRELAVSRNKELEEERERSNQLEKELSRLKAQYGEVAKQRDKNADSVTYWKCKCHQLEAQIADIIEERERSNQLEEQLTTLKCECDLAKKLAKNLMDEKWTLKEELEEECKRSNQLEKRCHDLVEDRDRVIEFWEGKFQKVKTQFELAKKFLHMRREEVSRLKEELRQVQLVKDAQKKVIDEKENALLRLNHEIWELQEQAEYWEDIAKKYADPDGHKVNNPANFCGNCKYFSLRPNDVGFCNNKHADPFIVDPDDASCQAFESNKPNVVIDKPEFPCCEHCSHEDCDDCTLCPF